MSEKQETHTPGPWHCGRGNGEGAIFANNGKRLTIENGLHSLHPICHVQNTFGKEDQANARLIASAPELLEQCKLFEKLLSTLIMEGDSGADLERDNLRAILDRVEGESA